MAALDLARALIELRQAAEKEILSMEETLKKPLTPFEKELVRCAFKGGAVFGAARKLNAKDL